jgi:hypothetical protein
MPARTTRQKNIARRRRRAPSVTLPGTATKINLPDRAGLAWYVGIGAMAAFELIEWPVALLVASTHFIENHSHNRDIEELAEGFEAGA